MLALIPKVRRNLAKVLLFAAAATFVSCATQKQAVVDDPDSKKESMIPWNKQERWETQGQLAGITDRR